MLPVQFGAIRFNELKAALQDARANGDGVVHVFDNQRGEELEVRSYNRLNTPTRKIILSEHPGSTSKEFLHNPDFYPTDAYLKRPETAVRTFVMDWPTGFLPKNYNAGMPEFYVDKNTTRAQRDEIDVNMVINALDIVG